MYGIVYHVTHPKDPGRVRYVGQTKGTMARRENNHWSDVNRRRENSRLQNWLFKYRGDRGTIEFTPVFEAQSKDELNALEMREIARLKAQGQADLNITAGGDGGLGLPWSEESRAKLSKTLSGTGAWKAKLTWEQVAEIRARYLAGERWSDMLDEYGVARGTMQKIARNTTWVDPNYTPPTIDAIKARGDYSRPLLTEHQVKEMRNRAQSEVRSFEDWGREYGVSESVAGSVLNNMSHHDPNFDPTTTLRRLPRRTLRVLNREQVVEARELARQGAQATELATRFGVGPGAIRDVVRGTTWADVPGAYPEAFQPKRVELRADPIEVERLRARYAEGGVSTPTLAKEYGVSVSTIRNALLKGALIN